MWDALEEAIPDTRDRLVIDLNDTTFIDSTALAVFVRAFKRLRHNGADLVLRNPNKLARKVLQVTGLDGVMTIDFRDDDTLGDDDTVEEVADDAERDEVRTVGMDVDAGNAGRPGRRPVPVRDRIRQ